MTLPAASEPTTAAPFGLRDLCALAPEEYRRRRRALSEIRAVILHQTGFGSWKLDNRLWPRVRAHFVIHKCGLISQNHPITERLRYGSGLANAWAITIEHEGNYPLRYDDGRARYWQPERFGRDRLEDSPRQVQASRALLTHLAAEIPGLQVGAHRHVEAAKSGCPGPDLWREVGQYAIDRLGMPEVSRFADGLDVPADWRGEPRIALDT